MISGRVVVLPMRLGMMQPYFFPYVGYFSLIRAVDLWVVFDTAQYIRRGWVNRNRVLSNGADGWKYVRVPVRHQPRETAICDIVIDNAIPWRLQLLRNLDAYQRRRAPRYSDVSDWLKQVLGADTAIASDAAHRPDERLSPLLIHLLQQTCDYIGIPFHFQVFSQMNPELPKICEAGDWALQVAKALRADCYINAPGGRGLFEPGRFRRENIDLQFLEPQLPRYAQGADEFIPGLSVIDLLMWNSPERVRELIECYSLSPA